MTFYASPRDVPAAWERKKIIFYEMGLKIYGQIPYILSRRLQAKFISNNTSFMGGRITASTGEDNYTIIPRLRDDGEPHSPASIEALLEWLQKDAGYSWGVASNIDGEWERKDLLYANFWNDAPATYIPDGGNAPPMMEAYYTNE